MPQTICLTMIVKNEAHVLARCIASVRPLISTWCIVDTGSTDGTRQVAEQAFAGMPGAFHERPWRDFAHNRSEAMELSRGLAEYQLVVDADDVLEYAADFRMPELTLDAYRLRIRYAESSFERMQLFRSASGFRYEGILHEHPTCPQPHTEAVLAGVTYVVMGGGARSRDPEKYARDAAVLEAALVHEPNNARHVFYLAQSYRDSGQIIKSIKNYERRVSLGGWDEEVYISLLSIARLRSRLGEAPSLVREAFLAAYNFRPSRAEALVDLAGYCRGRGEFPLAFLFAQMANQLSIPPDLLFVEPAAYHWRAIDEMAVAAYYTGRRPLAVQLNQRLLSEGHLPDHERARVQANLDLGV